MKPGRLQRAFDLAVPTLAISAGLLLAPATEAATFVVGTGSGCTHTNIQDAIDDAETNPGADIVRITRTMAWTAQELVVNTSQELTLVGGFETCGTDTPSGMTTLSGAGGNPRQVLRIIHPTGVMRLQHLMIRDGDPASDADGGGIYYHGGNGRLEVAETSIIQNQAGYGAGLYARGTDDLVAQVVFRQNVIVGFNTARYSGGGVYVNQLRSFTMHDPGSVIMWNTAQGNGGGGYGGGLMILDSGAGTNAHIGSGQPGLGAIVSNTAVFGGGVAIVGDDPGSVLTTIYSYAALSLQQTVAGYPARIRDNVATQSGGGIYMRSYTDFDDTVRTLARIWNAEISANTAPAGAAIYSDSGGEGPSEISINDTASFPGGAGACPTGQFCGGIFDNLAQTADGAPTAGAVIHLEDGSHLAINVAGIGSDPDAGPPLRGGLRIEGNRGGRLLLSDDGDVSMRSLMVAENEVTDVLIRQNEGRFRAADVTLAGNAVGGSHVFVKGAGSPSPDFILRRSVVWQPGTTILQCNGCSREFASLIASERDSLDAGQTPHVSVRDPRFIDPARGDYRPRAASPMVDAIPAIVGEDRDALGHPRDMNLPIVVPGVRDIGSYERQALLPLVLNADFDADLNLWSTVTPGVTTRDTTFNASGASGSGSAKVSQTNVAFGQAIHGMTQCVHLPGPGIYTVNGWGRGTGNITVAGDIAQLHWEFRRDGGEACTFGPADSSGFHTLSSTASWVRPLNPALVNVSAAEWTSNSSIAITLVGNESGASGNPRTLNTWFDGITLDIIGSDRIFADGFDP